MLFQYPAAISSYSNPHRASIEPQKGQLTKQGDRIFKMFGTGLFFLISLFFAIPAFPADVTLAWDPNSETDLDGYGVYYKKGAPGPPFDLFGYVTTDEFSDPSNPIFTVTGLEKGAKYYFALTAFDSVGTESNFSDAVCAEVGDVIAPCSTETPVGGGGSSGGGSSSGGGGGSNNGCFIDTLSADGGSFGPGMAAPIALACLAAFIRIAQRHSKRFFPFCKRPEPHNNTL